MPNSGLTYGTDITTRTQLIDGLNSQRVFFDDAAKLHELEPTANPFLTLMLQTSKKKAGGDLESYLEHRGSYITDHMYYVKANTTDAIAALNANAADLAGLTVSVAAAGAAIMPFRAGDVLMLVNPLDETQTATIIVKAVAAGVATYRLLTATPGFNIVKDNANATKVFHMSRAFAEGSNESEARYERPLTCWNEIGSFKESFSITDQLSANKQTVYGNEVALQLKWAQMRMMRDVDRMLLTASRRINCTNPFSAPGDLPLLNANGQTIRTSISLEQGIQAANSVGIAGPRLFKITAATLTPDILDATINNIHEYGSDRKYAFAGAGALETLTAMARKNAQYQMVSGDTEFGLKWKRYQTPLADINIHPHRGMKGRLYNAIFIVDTSNIHLRQYIPMYTKPLVTNATARKWEIRWDIGLRMYLPEAHSMIMFV